MAKLEETYLKYLSTAQLDFDGVMRLPVGAKIFSAMVKKHNDEKNNFLKIKDKLIEAITKNNCSFWSDTHFFHKNIIKYTGRPFKNEIDMNCLMLKNWNSFKQDDFIVHGGDVSFSNAQLTHEYISGCPGINVLILGNHDFNKKDNSWRDPGIFKYITLCFEFEHLGGNYWVTHYPINKDLIPFGTINIHGHTHDKWVSHKHLNISSEYTNYKPIKFLEVLKLEESGAFIDKTDSLEIKHSNAI